MRPNPNLLTKLASQRSRPKSSMSTEAKSGALIFLHGLGDEGASWRMQLAQICPQYMHLSCPTAPNQPVTINFGMSCNSWFDIRGLSPGDSEDEKGIREASKSIHNMLDEQVRKGVPSERILLGGFSQGGALALYSGLTYPKRLAGLIGLSCWLPVHKQFPAASSKANNTTPILLCHGEEDPIVSIQWAEMSKAHLATFIDESLVTFKRYDNLGHSQDNRCFKELVKFFATHVPKDKA